MILRRALGFSVLTTVLVFQVEASAGEAQYMYWTDTFARRVQRANIDGSNVATLVETPAPRGIALDVDAGKMYWSDSVSDKIYRANLDGSGAEVLITAGLGGPRDIALDLPAGKMYWIDRITDKVQRANLDGSDIEDLVTTGLENTYGFNLDLIARKMYWTDAHIPGEPDGKIQRANMDGSEIEDLIVGLLDPVAIEVDPIAGKMYWIDEGTDSIRRADLDGSNIEDIITTGLDYPLGIALDLSAGKVYWTDTGTDKIQRCNLDGTDVEDLVTVGLDNPREIALLFCGDVGPDCQGNGIPDYCEILTGADPDCNGNDIPDVCDITTGVSEDCYPTGNGIPDECEPDCNENDVADSCDIAIGASVDCAGEGIPDECESDCNGNGNADSCDIQDGLSYDCAGEGVPDECEPDCNANGVADTCDIETDVSGDCNRNDIPDECDLIDGIYVPCGVVEMLPTGSTGPFLIDGHEIIIPTGGVQVEFKVMLSGWGNVPGNPLLDAFSLIFEGESQLGSNAIPGNPGVDLIQPEPVECTEASDCAPPLPPPVTQTQDCGILFSDLCDDTMPGYFRPKVCSDDLVTPCVSNDDCPYATYCAENPEFVFGVATAPVLILWRLLDGSLQWAGLPWVMGGSKEDPDGVTKFEAAVLRLIVPEDAKGTYPIRFRSGWDWTYLLDPHGQVVPSTWINAQLTIGGACCGESGSCEFADQAQCDASGRTFVVGVCEGDRDGDDVTDACDPCPYDNPDDSDGDGVCDSDDGCPDDPNKTEPGECGCGKLDEGDSDGDGVPDCLDQCLGVDDSVYAPDCLNAIPTVSQWGMIILTVLLLVSAKIYFGRPRRAVAER